jgi:hypothetical protein
MPNTTRPSPALESIDVAALVNVQGGCGKKKCRNCAPQAIAIAAAQPPAPIAAPPAPAPMDSISTSVSVSYQ